LSIQGLSTPLKETGCFAYYRAGTEYLGGKTRFLATRA
jgi:hypothetical protein